MGETKSYFFCGVGGSGMLPLAAIVRAQGHEVKGSDRSLDAGRTATKFDYLRRLGIALFPQDGSGVTSSTQLVVASAAVEETVPDIVAAAKVGASRVRRADLLAELVNAAPCSIAVGGTSGKSTTTGMIGWILHALGKSPTVMNGAVMKNFMSDDAPFASAIVGDGGLFVSEVDESDGSIALYRPTIAVLNNVSLDHKSMEELRALFAGFLGKAEKAVVNLDDPETALIAGVLPPERLIGFGFAPEAEIAGGAVEEAPDGVSFTVTERSTGASARVRLRVPGRHNAANALAALAAARAAGVGLDEAARALEGFEGLRRRLELVGQANGVTVIDDFGHNPDKIAATLDTLHAFPGRLLIFFQPHGYGPLKVMKDALIACFRDKLGADDVLILSDPAYFGGTVSREVGSADIVAGVGGKAEHIPDRAACGDRLAALARPGDRIVVMGARDDTLSTFAADLLARIAAQREPGRGTGVHAGMAERTPIVGWTLDRAQRAALLERFAPRYAETVADHVTLGRQHELPKPATATIVGRADDDAGVEALVVAVDGATGRPDGGAYHITWSLEGGRKAKDSNDVIAARGWEPLEGPFPLDLEPGRW